MTTFSQNSEEIPRSLKPKTVKFKPKLKFGLIDLLLKLVMMKHPVKLRKTLKNIDSKLRKLNVKPPPHLLRLLQLPLMLKPHRTEQ